MSNINNVNNIISDLDRIDSLYREFNTVSEEIQDLPDQKEKKKNDHQVILNDDERKFIKKHLINSLIQIIQKLLMKNCNG